jgi:hypothetical protein
MESIKLIEEPYWIQDFNKMNERLKNTFSDMVELQEKLVCEKLISNRDKALEELVRARLYNLNYKFTKDDSFYDFIKDRLTRIADENNNGYIYLDYISESNKGVLLVRFSSKIDYDFDNLSGKITMSIG